MTTYEETLNSTWTCDCVHSVTQHRGQADHCCSNCGQWFNAFGQRLRRDAMNNPSMHDEEIGDLEGFEMSHAGD